MEIWWISSVASYHSTNVLIRWRIDNQEQVDDEELEEIIKRAREMEERYGHYFDMIIIYRCVCVCVLSKFVCECKILHAFYIAKK